MKTFCHIMSQTEEKSYVCKGIRDENTDFLFNAIVSFKMLKSATAF